ncbi:MAG: hypothetical protein ACYC0E_12355, partial [Acidimicrobiales bacterium]
MDGHTPAARSAGPLRGAAVEVNARLVGKAAGVAAGAALLVTVLVLTVAGIQKNAEISELRSHGVAVDVHATGCIGLMGGSGSNLAGYQCSGWFSLGGRRHTATIPDGRLHPPGSVVRGVTVPTDPALLATAGQLATEHPSAKVFLAPGVLLAVVVIAGCVALALRRRRAAGPSVARPTP